MAHPHRGPDEALPDLPVYLHLPGRLRAGGAAEPRQLLPRECGESKEIFAFVAPRVVGKKWEETKADANVASRSCARTSASCASEFSVSLAGPVSRLTEKERETLMTSTSQKEMFDIIKEAGIFFSEEKEEEKQG